MNSTECSGGKGAVQREGNPTQKARTTKKPTKKRAHSCEEMAMETPPFQLGAQARDQERPVAQLAKDFQNAALETCGTLRRASKERLAERS